MKGIVLAGGTGSRLFPLTKITNKHLLPIYDKPMIYYPIQTLVDAGITDIMVVTGGKNSGDFLRLLANGKHFGLKHIAYTYQEGEGGIADALNSASISPTGRRSASCSATTSSRRSIRDAVDASARRRRGATILLKEVHDAERFGVAEFQGDRIVGIEEKPAHPEIEIRRHRHLYVRRHGVRQDPYLQAFAPQRARDHRCQQRLYPRRHDDLFLLDGWWTDAGTFESLLRAANLVAGSRQDSGQANGQEGT